MRALIQQIEASLGSRLYFLSLFVSLSIPDICGALDSDDGKASGPRYIQWYETWTRPRFAEMAAAAMPSHMRVRSVDLENPLTGEACYQFRCSILHQGSSQHPKSPFARIMFIEPGATGVVVHYGRLNDALCIDLPRFCQEIIAGARFWLDKVESSEKFLRNYERFVRRHPNGLAPYIGGVPVVS